MVSNKLSVYPNKTDYLLFNPKHAKIQNFNIIIDSNIITPNDSAKNLDVFSNLICLWTNTFLQYFLLVFFTFVIFLVFALSSLQLLP